MTDLSWLLMPQSAPGLQMELRALAETEGIEQEQVTAIADALRLFPSLSTARPIEEDGKCRRLRLCRVFSGGCPVLTDCGAYNVPPPPPACDLRQ